MLNRYESCNWLLPAYGIERNVVDGRLRLLIHCRKRSKKELFQKRREMLPNDLPSLGSLLSIKNQTKKKNKNTWINAIWMKLFQTYSDIPQFRSVLRSDLLQSRTFSCDRYGLDAPERSEVVVDIDSAVLWWPKATIAYLSEANQVEKH